MTQWGRRGKGSRGGTIALGFRDRSGGASASGLGTMRWFDIVALEDLGLHDGPSP